MNKKANQKQVMKSKKAEANARRKVNNAYSGRYPFTNSGDIRSVRW